MSAFLRSFSLSVCKASVQYWCMVHYVAMVTVVKSWKSMLTLEIEIWWKHTHSQRLYGEPILQHVWPQLGFGETGLSPFLPRGLRTVLTSPAEGNKYVSARPSHCTFSCNSNKKMENITSWDCFHFSILAGGSTSLKRRLCYRSVIG